MIKLSPECARPTARSCRGKENCSRLPSFVASLFSGILWESQSAASGEEASWGPELWDEQTAPAEQGGLLIHPSGAS